MTMEIIRSTLGWCTLINAAILTLWLLMFVFGRGFIFRVHGSIFPMAEDRFAAIHYAGMTAYKTFIIAANLVPYVALGMVS